MTRDAGGGLRGRVRGPEHGGDLVVAVPVDPGWTLTVDGRETPIHPALGILVGAWVGPGEHEIRLSYTTPGARLGWLVSLGTLTGLGLAATLRLRHRRLLDAER